MKRFFPKLLQSFLTLMAALILMPSPFTKAAAGLNLPSIPNNEADGFVRQTFGSAPLYEGIAPENSWFTVDIQPAGGSTSSPTPPIPAGRYAMWCVDSATDINPGGPGFSIPGTLYGGRLYSTSDPSVGFNAFLPNHPSVIHDAATWKKVNYLINHRSVACNGAVPRMWEVETALLILLGQETLASMPSTAQGYPPLRAEVVQCLVDAANAQAAAWQPVCGDKVAVIFNIDINWDNVAPEVQLLIMEVPIPCTSLGDFVWNDTNGNGLQDAGEPGIPGVSVELYRCVDNLKISTTTTDANGKYLFSNLIPGDYYVKVLAPSGYVFTTPNAAGTTTDNDSDANASGVMPCTTLTAGENDLSWDAGLLQVPILLHSTLTSCSQVVTYDASLFSSPVGTIVSATFNPASGSTFPFGNSTVNYSVSDSAGNTRTGTFTVTIIDVIAPVITPIANITRSIDAGKCTAKVEYSTTATDCNLQSITYSPASGSDFPVGTSTVTITATDKAGLISTSIFTVTVNDTEAPVFTSVPVNMTVNNDAGQCYATVNYTATATDCTAVTMTYSPASGSHFTVGTTTTVTVTAKDAAGNTTTSTFTVTVKDTEAPVFTSVPANMTVNNDAGQCYATVNFTATATDCTAVTMTYSPASGSQFAIGTTSTVTVTAKDTSGNTSTSTFTVTVKDASAPVIAPIANITKQADAGLCSAVVTFTATATDCSPVTVTTSPVSGTAFAVGTTTVTVTAKDSAGNTSTSTFTVTVTDKQAPTITSPVVNLSLPVDTGKCYATFTYVPTATDNCAGNIGMTVSPASGSQFAAGTTTIVTVTATDSAGNVTTKTFSVTVAQCLGSLGNFVWNDLNRNGVQDAGEPGIDGVKVTLYTAAGVQMGSPTTTAGGGFYQFVNLTPGSYYVIFDKTTLPAGFVFTSQSVGADTADSDANPTTGKSEGNATVVAGQFNDTVDAGAYAPAPGMTLTKTAYPLNPAPFQPVTYTYTVRNTGGTTLTNIVVKDDNATPTYAADDVVVGTIASLAPGATATLTAQIVPVVSTSAVVNGGNVACGNIIVCTLPNGDVKCTYRQDFNLNDNTYGNGSIGWGSYDKTFSQMLTTDKVEFRFYDKNNNPVLGFCVDTISACSSVTVPGTGQVISYPSGYGCMGPFGGDGSMVTGNRNHIVSFSSSLSDNLNHPLNVSHKSYLTNHSPTALSGGNVVCDTTNAPGGWDHVNSYTVVIKAACFGTSGFGSVSIPNQCNSPAKTGCNQVCPKPVNCSVTNRATATTGSLVASATATVTVTASTPPASTGSIGSLVWADTDGDGIQDAGEHGIAGLTVQLKNSSGTVIATDVTDGSGVYGFTGLSAGTYTVVVATPSGFTASPKAAGSNRLIDSNGGPATVTLATNSSSDQSIDFGFVPTVTCGKNFLTYTQGAWGSNACGNNASTFLTKNFAALYPSGYVTIGSGTKVLKFTSATAVNNFLPQGGTAGTLSASATNPTTSSAGVLAGQLLALRLNLDFSNAGRTLSGLGAKKVASGTLAGKTVTEVVAIANSVISGGTLPSGVTLSSLTTVLTSINENYDGGNTNKGYLY